MAGRRSLNGAFEKAVAGGCWQAGRQWNTFPGNRFSLELVDVLLETPVVFPLKQPDVTVGMFGENTWNLPLESLLGSELFELLRTRWEDKHWAQKPLLTLQFKPENCTWRAVRAHTPDHTLLGTKNFVLEPGVKVDFALGYEDDCIRSCNNEAENFGFFSVILHDANQPQQSAAASTFVQKLASLPPVALGMIASHLKPFECIHNFCPLSPSIPQKLRAVGVQWCELTFSAISGHYESESSSRFKVRLRNLLDCLRALKLVAAGDTFKSFYLGEGQGDDGLDDAWSISDGVSQLVFRAAKKLIFAPKLQDLWLAASWLPHIDPTAPLPGSLRNVYIAGLDDGCSDSDPDCLDFWVNMSRLKLPVAADVRVLLHVQGPGTYYETDAEHVQYPAMMGGFSLPNVVSVKLESCEHTPFLPPKALPNLQKLELKCSTLRDPETCAFSIKLCPVSDTLQESSFPKLMTVNLWLLDQPIKPLSKIVNALATAAPNLEVLELQLSIDKAHAEGQHIKSAGRDQESLMRHLTATVGPLRRFLKLQRLKMNFTNPVAADKLESILHFCLALLGTKISIFELDCVDCSGVWSKGAQAVCELLQQSGKAVVLIRRAPERIDLPCAMYCQKGLSDYKVIVHDHGLTLSKEVL